MHSLNICPSLPKEARDKATHFPDNKWSIILKPEGEQKHQLWSSSTALTARRAHGSSTTEREHLQPESVHALSRPLPISTKPCSEVYDTLKEGQTRIYKTWGPLSVTGCAQHCHILNCHTQLLLWLYKVGRNPSLHNSSQAISAVF